MITLFGCAQFIKFVPFLLYPMEVKRLKWAMLWGLHHILLKASEGLAKFFVHYLFLGTSETFFALVSDGNLLVPGHVSTFAISTPLLYPTRHCILFKKYICLFFYVHGIMNTSGLLQRDPKFHDSMNRQSIHDSIFMIP